MMGLSALALLALAALYFASAIAPPDGVALCLIAGSTVRFIWLFRRST